MPRKKKEELIEKTVLEEQPIDGPKKTRYTVPVIDYRVVIADSVPEYIYNGYFVVGGVGNKYNCWYQAVLKQWTEDVEMTEEEYNNFDWEKFNNEHRGAEL